MARQNYVGLTDAERTFATLRPYVSHLRAIQQACRPATKDHQAITAVIDAMDTAAYHFTRRPHFYDGDNACQPTWLHIYASLMK